MANSTRVIKRKTRKYIKIPYEFFERQLLSANADHIRIYLYAFYETTRDEIELSNEQIMEALDVSLDQINATWDYFLKEGLLSISDNSIEFLDLESVYKAKPNSEPQVVKEPKEKKNVVDYLSGNSEFKKQITYIEMQLGKEVSHKDLEDLHDLFIEQKVPFDVVAAAVGYCVTKDVKNISYIAKTALAWFSEGLTDYEKIEEYLWNRERAHNETDKYEQLKDIFKLNRDFYDVEKKYIDTWTNEFGADKAKISDAIDKTILNTGKINFPYIDKVIRTNSAGGFNKQGAPVTYSKKTAFHNFNQPGFDYDKISEALRAKQAREK